MDGFGARTVARLVVSLASPRRRRPERSPHNPSTAARMVLARHAQQLGVLEAKEPIYVKRIQKVDVS